VLLRTCWFHHLNQFGEQCPRRRKWFLKSLRAIVEE
jgi:hypothetical protein